jgi:hypothetical protein
MSGKNTKIILSTLGLGVCLLAFRLAQAESVGDIYYPPIGQEKMSKEQMKAMHDERLKQMEENYKTKVQALEARYQEKVKQAEEHHEQMMKKRESLADYKKERMTKRTELQENYVDKRNGFESGYEDSKNPYMLEQKERQEYFDKKNGVNMQESGKSDGLNGMPHDMLQNKKFLEK